MKKLSVFGLLILFIISFIGCEVTSQDETTTSLVTLSDTVSFTVSFNDGGFIQTQNVVESDTVIQPNNPEKVGCEFVGWYRSFPILETDKPYDFSTPVTSNFTLYAKWIDHFTPVYTSTVENDQAIFVVMIDQTEIATLNVVFSVSVAMTTKVEIDSELYTSSYGNEGLIAIRMVSIDDEEVFLYSEFYDIPVNEALLNVHLDQNETLLRTMDFARLPFHGGAGGEKVSPIGLYIVQVGLYTLGWEWIDTDIIVRVHIL